MPSDQLESARLAWQHSEAELHAAMAELEKRVVDGATPEDVLAARTAVARFQSDTELLLQRYITQLGKS
jgi:hypothetical protein